ncbi:MAG TPA: transcriptional repressor [Bacteroidia bacterium]|nr:transcriptional repressor [Bacteroidia bacterium]
MNSKNKDNKNISATKNIQDSNDVFQQVKKILDDYLKKKGLRKTLERYNVLAEIYSINDHFEIEELYERMKTKKYRVSRATLYNNMELFVDAGLVIKHQFGTNTAQYERAYNYRQHDHLICVDCNKVFEFCDPRIIQIQKTTEQLLGFNVLHHSLQFFGKCKKLETNGQCENKKTKI